MRSSKPVPRSPDGLSMTVTDEARLIRSGEPVRVRLPDAAQEGIAAWQLRRQEDLRASLALLGFDADDVIRPSYERVVRAAEIRRMGGRPQ